MPPRLARFAWLANKDSLVGFCRARKCWMPAKYSRIVLWDRAKSLWQYEIKASMCLASVVVPTEQVAKNLWKALQAIWYALSVLQDRDWLMSWVSPRRCFSSPESAETRPGYGPIRGRKKEVKLKHDIASAARLHLPGINVQWMLNWC